MRLYQTARKVENSRSSLETVLVKCLPSFAIHKLFGGYCGSNFNIIYFYFNSVEGGSSLYSFSFQSSPLSLLLSFIHQCELTIAFHSMLGETKFLRREFLEENLLENFTHYQPQRISGNIPTQCFNFSTNKQLREFWEGLFNFIEVEV